MRQLFFWIVTLAIIGAVGFWAWSTFQPAPRYANGAEDVVQAGAEPTPPAPADPAFDQPPPQKAPDATGLPSQPVPYDQLNNGQPPAEPGAPPAPKSDDKAIFY